MRDLRLKSSRFREEREWDWRRLERLLQKLEGGSPAKLTDDEILSIPVLYRSALSSLSVARATSLDRALVEYLESLCARAYFFVYGARSTPLERLSRFFREDWPRSVRSLWRETLLATLIFFAGALAAYLLVASDPSWFHDFVAQDMAQGRGPDAPTQALRDGLYRSPKGADEMLGAFAAFLFTHNAQIAILSFALGFAFGAPTAFLQALNGCMLGAFLALYASRGLAFELGGWLMIHGVTEIFAIILSGAAGFRIGWAVAFPGEQTRLEAASKAGREGATVMIGTVLMLIVAGVLEGFGRQLITSDLARYSIAAGSAVVWLAYFYLPRAERTAHGPG
jgi:uncharacterized membrane protein SpoIIM required for sporulation